MHIWNLVAILQGSHNNDDYTYTKASNIYTIASQCCRAAGGLVRMQVVGAVAVVVEIAVPGGIVVVPVTVAGVRIIQRMLRIQRDKERAREIIENLARRGICFADLRALCEKERRAKFQRGLATDEEIETLCSPNDKQARDEAKELVRLSGTSERATYRFILRQLKHVASHNTNPLVSHEHLMDVFEATHDTAELEKILQKARETQVIEAIEEHVRNNPALSHTKEIAVEYIQDMMQNANPPELSQELVQDLTEGGFDLADLERIAQKARHIELSDLTCEQFERARDIVMNNDTFIADLTEQATDIISNVIQDNASGESVVSGTTGIASGIIENFEIAISELWDFATSMVGL